MRSMKSLLAMTAVALAAVTPVSQAALGDAYQASFQGLTFTFQQTTARQLTFEVAGTPSGDWAGVQYFGAFDLKDLGLDFSAGNSTGTANGPGAVDLAGLNSQLGASNLDCSKATGETGSICFDIDPDQPLGSLPFDFQYTIDFSDDLSIASTGPHLQVVFTDVQNGKKIGSLYSSDVGLRSSSNASFSSGFQAPEPDSSALALLGVGLLGASLWARKRQA